MNKYEVTDFNDVVTQIEADDMGMNYQSNIVTFTVKGPYTSYAQMGEFDVGGGYYPNEVVGVFSNVKKAIRIGEST